MTSYKDYFLLLSPGEQVNKTIKLCKILTKSIIDDFPSVNSSAHISIRRYLRQKPYVIESAIDRLEAKINRIPCANLQIENFNFFVHPHDKVTFYAAIKPTFQVDNWLSKITACVQIPANSVTPHITIARTIQVDSFYKVWPKFYNKSYREDFIIDRLLILEKETLNPESKWRIYRELKFDKSQIVK